MRTLDAHIEILYRDLSDFVSRYKRLHLSEADKYPTDMTDEDFDRWLEFYLADRGFRHVEKA